MRRLLAKGILALMALPFAALVLGFAGDIHPAGDSLAVFRLPLAAIVGGFSVLLVLLGSRWRGAGGLVVVAVSVVTTLPPAAPGPAGGQVIRVYQKNLLRLLDHSAQLMAEIRASGADIVTLQEISRYNRAEVEALRDLYPYQKFCDFPEDKGQAVLSRFPALGPELPCDAKRRLAGMLVDTGRYHVWVVSVHLVWPFPGDDQMAQAEDIGALIAALDAPIIAGGDFNMVPWGASVRNLARSGSMELAGYAGATFKLPKLPLSIPIDHVMMPAGSRAAHAELRDTFLSDHKGVFTRFELP